MNKNLDYLHNHICNYNLHHLVIFQNKWWDEYQWYTLVMVWRKLYCINCVHSRLWPTYASAHNNLGTLMHSAPEAEVHFQSAISISPNHVNAHYNLGQVYRYEGLLSQLKE